MAASLCHPPHVLFMGHHLKMLWVHAPAVYTRMVEFHTPRHVRLSKALIRPAMRRVRVAQMPESAVASVVSMADPDPAAAGLVAPDKTLEPCLSVLARSHFFRHRARAALRAISRRCSDERPFQRAFPPILPPSRPQARKSCLTASSDACGSGVRFDTRLCYCPHWSDARGGLDIREGVLHNRDRLPKPGGRRRMSSERQTQ